MLKFIIKLKNKEIEVFSLFLKINKIKKIIKSSNNIVFFGGAGISTESGIPDFRTSSTLSNKNPREILSSTFFYRYTDEFYEYFRENRIGKNIEPNISHKYLSKLEKKGILKAIVTQNIDGLHQLAGSKNVIELHGNFNEFNCIKCEQYYEIHELDMSKTPYCKCGSVLKPKTILYEENLDDTKMVLAKECISNSDTLIIAGTSLMVNPAAGLIRNFKGENLIIINKTKTPYDSYANVIINDSIGKVFSKL